MTPEAEDSNIDAPRVAILIPCRDDTSALATQAGAIVRHETLPRYRRPQ